MKKFHTLLAAMLIAGQPLVAAVRPSYTAGKYALILDGVFAGWIQSVEGGNATADVIEEPQSPTPFVKKHIGQPRYEDFTVEVNLSMGKPLFDWIESVWQAEHVRKDGSIVACDFEGKALSSQEFFNAMITEVVIPAADTSSKEPGKITLKITPEYTRYMKGDGKKISGKFNKEQKLWLPSNFKLEIDGLPTAKVHKVESFTIKQKIKEEEIGDIRDPQKEPGKLEFPNIKITFAQTDFDTWYNYFKDFVIDGNSFEDKEKAGTLTFLSPNKEEVLLEIEFFNLGIFKLSDEKDETNPDAIKRLTAEFYCERMEFKVNHPAPQ